MSRHAEPVHAIDECVTGALATRADWAWELVYDWLAPQLRAFAVARAGRDEADDLVGTTFARMYAVADRFEGGPRELRAWAFAVLRNLIVDQHRRRTSESSAITKVIAGAADTLPNVTADVDPRMLAALDALPVRQRDALLLHVLGDLDYPSIAYALDVREATARQLVSRASRAMRTALG